jgi:gliding motility-associated-like protein
MKPCYRYKINGQEFQLLRIILSVSLLFFISIDGSGQCVNPPTVTLSSTQGTTCGTTVITVTGNSFGGSATKVTISENGDGSVTPTSASSSPFAFAYTPQSKDIGKNITITVTTDAKSGSHCTSAKATYTLTVNPVLSAPVAGTITQPTCTAGTGSVVLGGLPSIGTWTLTRTPGEISTTGIGTSTTISGLTTGTYTFKVTSSAECISPTSANVVINAQPALPASPTQLVDCALGLGKAIIAVTAPIGTGLQYRLDAGAFQNGTSFTNVANGNHTITVMNSSGCVSTGASFPVSCCSNLLAPSVGIITQPTCSVLTGSVILSGLPSTGIWTLTRYPGTVTSTGTGTTITISGLVVGVYNYSVISASGCTSGVSASVVITAAPCSVQIVITDPAPVCFPSTVDLTSPEVTAGSAPDLTFSYWADAAATMPHMTPGTSTTGTYYIKGTTTAGLFTIKPVKVTVYRMPSANAGTDQIMEYLFEATMNAELSHENETGTWSVISGTGVFADTSYARSIVDKLSIGKNKFLWTVTNRVCPASHDTVTIIVRDLVISTLITPNMDGRNDYFVLKELNTLGKTELIIFDRRGVQVYRNEDYNNLWNGVDSKGNPLPDDTYFCIIKTQNDKTLGGFIVIRR